MKKRISFSLFLMISLCLVVGFAVVFILAQAGQEHKKPVPVAIITTASPQGFTSEQTEQQITGPLEKALGQIREKISLHSVSTAERSVITVFSEEEENNKDLFYRVRDLVSEQRKILPADLQLPIIYRPLSDQVFMYTLQSTRLSALTLTEFQEEALGPEVLSLPEVEMLESFGGQEMVINICPEKTMLQYMGLSVPDFYNQLEMDYHGLSRLSTKLPDPYAVQQKGIKELAGMDELAHYMVHGEEGKHLRLKDFCRLTSEQRNKKAFSGRSGNRAILGMVYVRKGFPPAETKDLIMRKILQHPLVASGEVEVKPFEIETQEQAASASPYKASVLAAICFFCITVLSFFTDLPLGKKVLSLAGIFLVLFLVPLLLYLQKAERENETIHLALYPQRGDTMSPMEQEELAAIMVRKITQDKNIADMVWYGIHEEAGPEEKGSIHFYIHPAPGADHSTLLKNLYKILKTVPGYVENRSLQEEGEFPRQEKIKVSALSLEQLKEALRQVRTALQDLEGIENVYSRGEAMRPVLQYRINRETAAGFSISLDEVSSLVQPPRTFEMKKAKLILGCENEPVDFNGIMARDMNTGKLVPVSKFVEPTLVSSLAAIYHQDRERYAQIIFTVADESMKEKVQQHLEQLKMPRGCELRWEE